MSGHRVRQDIALTDTIIVSSTAGELLDARRVWGAQYVINTGGAEARTVVEPAIAGQRMELVGGTMAGTATIAAPSGQDFDGGGGDAIAIAAEGQWAILESFLIGSAYEWRVTSKHASVTVS